jgi:hypothetical protein
MFLGYYFSVLLRLPPSLLLCFFSAPRCRRSFGHVLRRAAPVLLWAEPRAAPAQRHRLPRAALSSPRRATPPGHLPELPLAAARRCCNPIGATSCSLQFHVSFPTLPPPSRPRAGRSCFPHVAPPLPVPPRAPPACQLLLPHGHILFWTPSTSYSSLSTRSCIRTHTFLFLDLCSDHPTSSVLRRRPWPPSSAAYTTLGPRSSAARAPQ